MTSSPNPTADAEEDLRKLLTEFAKREVKFDGISGTVKVCPSEEETDVVMDYITTHYVPREQVEQTLKSVEFHALAIVNDYKKAGSWTHDGPLAEVGALRVGTEAVRQRLVALHRNQSTSKEKGQADE